MYVTNNKFGIKRHYFYRAKMSVMREKGRP